MKILVTGATGFTGSFTVPHLLREGHQLRCFVRNPDRAEPLKALGCEIAAGDLGSAAGLERAMAGCDALVNIASLGFGHAEGIVAAAEEAGVRRAIFISTTAVFTQLNAGSKRVRLAAEETIQKSSLAWTILRPTMIYGSNRDRNMCRLIRLLAKYPVIPVFGDGTSLMQPIYVDDLGAAIAAALGSPTAQRQAYNVSGREPLPYNEVIRTAASLMGRRPRICHFPHRPVIAALKISERARLRLPIKAEQIQRLNEDKAFSWSDAARDFGYAPRSFLEGIRAEIESMGLLSKVGATGMVGSCK